MSDHPTPVRPDGWAVAFARTVHRLRFPLVALWAVIIVAGFRAAEHVTYDPDVLVYFDEARPERQAFDAIEERFGRSWEVVTLVAPRSGTVFTPEAVEAMARLSLASARRPEVAAVRSPLDEIGVAAADALAADHAGRAAIAARLEALAEIPGDDARALLAADGSLAAVAAIVPAVASDNASVQEVAAAHAALRDEIAAGFPGMELLQTGRIVIDAAFLDESRDDVNTYASLQLAILAALVLGALGSVTLSAAVLATVLAIVGGTVGALAATGTPMNGISSAAPAVLMGLMVATAIHVVMAWQDALRTGASREEAVATAFAINARPVLLSILTTAVSFLVLNTAESPPFRQLGNITALGLLGILALTFTLLPALLMIVPRSTASHRGLLERAMAALGGAMVRARRFILTLTVLATALAAWGTSAITIDDTFSHYFDERYEVRRATDLFEAKLSGTTIVDLAVDAGAPGAALSPSSLERVAAMTAWLEARPEVARVESLTTVSARIPEEQRGQPAALAAAVEAMARQGTANLLDAEARHTRVSIVMRGVSSRDTLAFAAEAETEARRLFGDAIAITGMPVLSAQLSIESARSMIVGMALALGVISLILIVTLRDAALGAVSLVPNLLPVAIAFGIWGAIEGEISFAATVVGALTYGIVVDDTVHILAKYQRFRRTLTPDEAIRTAFRSVGVAVVVTSLALALSFLPFALSGFLVNHHFGALTAITLLAALVADLVFLPALVATVERWRSAAPALTDPSLSEMRR